jgi:hypothetical protein
MLGTEVTGKHFAVMHRFFYKASHSRFTNIISLKCEHLTFLKGRNCFGGMQWYVTAVYFSRKHRMKLYCETFPKVYIIFVFLR